MALAELAPSVQKFRRLISHQENMDAVQDPSDNFDLEDLVWGLTKVRPRETKLRKTKTVLQ